MKKKTKPTLHIMRGLPGSGKSTKANEILNRNFVGKTTVVRLNRDCLRKMLWPEAAWSPDFEEVVKKFEVAAAKAMVKLGYDVVIDDTNLGAVQPAYFRLGAEVMTHDLTGMSVEACLARNEMRRTTGGNYCSPEVIVILARRHGLLGKGEVNESQTLSNPGR